MFINIHDAAIVLRLHCNFFRFINEIETRTNHGINGINNINNDASLLKLKSKLKQFKDSRNVYLEHWEILHNKCGHMKNISNQKITIPDDIHHGNDELAGTTYIMYIWVRVNTEKCINNNIYFNTNISKEWNEYFANK